VFYFEIGVSSVWGLREGWEFSLLGLRWQAERDTAFARMMVGCCPESFGRPKAPSPLRSAGAVQDAAPT